MRLGLGLWRRLRRPAPAVVRRAARFVALPGTYLTAPNFTGNLSAFTVSHWVRLAANQKQRVFLSNFFGGAGWVTGVSDATDNRPKFYLGSGTLEGTTPLPVGEWTLLTCAAGAGVARIYLGPALDATAPLTPAYAGTPAATELGGSSVVGQWVDGDVDSVGYWSRALTADEVAALYAGGVGRTYQNLPVGLKVGLVAWHDLDEETGTRSDAHAGHDFSEAGEAIAAVAGKTGGTPPPPPPPPNTPPTISAIADQTGTVGVPVGPLAFTVGDSVTPAADLMVTRATSNATVLPLAGIVLSGAGPDRAVTLTAAAAGTAVATLRVTDAGGLYAEEAVALTASPVPPPPPPPNTPPTIGSIPDQSGTVGAAIGPIAFTIGDAETAAAALTLSAATSDPAVVPLSAVVFGGSGGNPTVTVTPAAAGSATLTVTVTDAGGQTASEPFAVTAAPVSPPPPPVASAMTYGVNVTTSAWFIPPPMLVNLAQAGDRYTPYTSSGDSTGGVAAVDANGDPTEDFTLIMPWLASVNATQDVTFRFTGYAGTISLQTAYSYSMLVAPAYDAGTNTTTFTVRAAANLPYGPTWFVRFGGTRRTGGAAGTTNTGVRNLVAAAPGYELADLDAGRVWREEYTDVYLSRFSHLRTMDVTGTNYSEAVNWADVRRRATHKSGGNTWDDLIDLSLETGKPAWVCLPARFTDAAVTASAQFLKAGLDPDLPVYVEHSNETWNTGFTQTGQMLNDTGAEVRGFLGSGGGRLMQADRAGTTVTLTTNLPHGWTVGTVLKGSFPGAVGYPAEFTVTAVPTDSTATFTLAGDPGNVTLSGGHWLVDTGADSNLMANGTDNFNYYVLKTRYCIRRLKQISDLYRAVYGDAAMGTKVRCVWADQMVRLDGMAALEWFAATYTDHPVSYWFWGFAGAPYFFPGEYWANPDATVDQLVTALTANAAAAKTNAEGVGYHYEQRAILARRLGLELITYEQNPDVTIPGGDNNNAAGNRRILSQLAPGLKPALKLFYQDQAHAGFRSVCVFNGDFLDPNGVNYFATWGLGLSPTDTTSPKIAAVVECIADGFPAISRNLIPGAVDGGYYAGRYDDPVADRTIGTDANGDKIGYVTYLADPADAGGGNVVLNITHTNQQYGDYAIRVRVNGVVVDDLTIPANPAGTYTLPGLAVTLQEGFNDFEFLPVGYLGNVKINSFAVGLGAPVDAPPTVSAIADQTGYSATPIGPLAFTVNDDVTAPGSLSLSKASSNTTLIPLAGIAFGGSGPSRTVTVTPAAGQTGTATVTVTVTDGAGNATNETFLVTVSAPTGPVEITRWDTTANLSGDGTYCTPTNTGANVTCGNFALGSGWAVPGWGSDARVRALQYGSLGDHDACLAADRTWEFTLTVAAGQTVAALSLHVAGQETVGVAGLTTRVTKGGATVGEASTPSPGGGFSGTIDLAAAGTLAAGTHTFKVTIATVPGTAGVGLGGSPGALVLSGVVAPVGGA